MRYKVNELEGALLDAAVARAEGHDFMVAGGDCLLVDRMRANHDPRYRPSVLWAEGGPIIERERIRIGPSDQEGWWAATVFHQGVGPTPLIAAMRAYVASKFGEEIDLPD